MQYSAVGASEACGPLTGATIRAYRHWTKGPAIMSNGLPILGLRMPVCEWLGRFLLQEHILIRPHEAFESPGHPP